MGLQKSRTRLSDFHSTPLHSLWPLGFSAGSDGKESAYNAGDPGSGRSHGEGNGNPLQYSCLENPIDRGGWYIIVYGVAKESDTTERLTLMVASFDSCISSFFICKYKSMTSISESLWNHDTNVGEVMTALGLGHILEEFAYPTPFPTTEGIFWAAGILDWSWISVFTVPHLIQTGWVRITCFQNFCPCYEDKWFQALCIFNLLGRNGDSQNYFRAQGDRWPRSLSLTLRCAGRVAHLYNGHPIPTRQRDLEYFSKLLLCLKNSFPSSGSPPVCAFIKQKGSSTIHHLGITVHIMNIYRTIQLQLGISTRVPGGSCLHKGAAGSFSVPRSFCSLLAVGTILPFSLNSAILVQYCALFTLTMSYDNYNLETHWFRS